MMEGSRLSCGQGTTAAITDDGRLFLWGGGGNGRLGRGSLANSAVPREVGASYTGDGLRVKAVCSGASHSLVLTQRGAVMAFGNGSAGKLGTQKTADALKPTEVLAGISVKAFSAGYNHSLALSTEGTVYVFGSSEHGQLGTGSSQEQVVPTELSHELLAGRRCAHVSAGGSHSLIATEDGKVYQMGYASLGEHDDWWWIHNKLQPAEVRGTLAAVFVKAVSCGHSHSLALSDAGKVFAWGCGGEGRLGLGGRQDVFVPMQVCGALSNERIQKISAGGAHSAAVTERGYVLLSVTLCLSP